MVKQFRLISKFPPLNFFDRSTAGDVVLVFPAGHGLAPTDEVEIVATVKPSIYNYKMTLAVVQFSASIPGSKK